MSGRRTTSAPQPTAPHFGGLLRQVRRRAGMTQRDLAAAVGYSVAMICSLEQGDRLPDVTVVTERFVPALALQDDPALAAHLVAAAASARGKHHPVTATVTRSITVTVEEVDTPAPLPAPPTPLVGRGRDLDLVCRRLAGHQGRLLTLTGAPGVGKTRLALEIAHRLAPLYTHGAAFIDLSAVESAAAVPATLALAFDLELGRNEALPQVIAHLRRKQMLIVLDNLEQLLAVAPLVSELLAACPGMCILATSRQRLHLRQEQRFTVAPLALAAAVELFAACVGARDLDLELLPTHQEVVAQICRELDCLPLAIELCAAQVSVYPPAALLARLRDRRLDMLTDGPGDLPAHHRTLANAIHRSYLLLTPPCQRLLRWLAPFAGGFDAEAVTTLGFTPADLRTLVEQNLVHQALQQNQRERYALLVTIRAYADEQLRAAGEEAAARHAHAACFLALAEGTPTPNQTQLDLLARNLDNLRAALRYWIDAGAHEAVRLAAALREFWYARGHLREGRAWLAQALAVDTVSDAARGYALLSAGQLAHNLGDHADAHARLAEALTIFAALQDERGQAATLNELAWLHFDGHDSPAAVDCFEQAMAFVRTLAAPGWLATLLSSTAMVLGYGDRSDPRIRAYFTESLALHQAADDANGRAHALMQLAVVDGLEGRYAEARQLAEEALLVVATLDRLRDLAWAHEVVGETRWYCDDMDGAESAYRQARAIFDELGLQEGVMLTEHHFGQIARRRGATAASRQHYRTSLALAHAQGDERMVGRSLAGLGALAASAGDDVQAATLLAAAWQRFDRFPAFLAPCDAADYRRVQDAVSARLAPAALATAWQTGQTLAIDALAEEA
ncbi:MAG TPA: helix-turn-helix domain-containing protein [Chloroflexi bacterium]|nr:helix-turn-helix domain-containing protein [Chloroflexota bacterium]